MIEELPADTSLMAYGFTEPSLVFYADRLWQMESSPDRFTDTWQQTPHLLAVTQRKEYPLFEWVYAQWVQQPARATRRPHEKIEQLRLSIPESRRTRIEGFNPARMSWSVLEVWIKNDADAGDTQ